MYIYQNGNLYIQDGESLVGVEIYSDKEVKVEGTETILGADYTCLTRYEVNCKWQISEETPYIFPLITDNKVEVVKNGTVGKVKTSNRKSNSK